MFAKLRKVRTKYLLNRDNCINVGRDTYLRNDFYWEIREQSVVRPAIIIGKECIVGGTYIIENERAKIEIGDASTVGAKALLVAADSNIIIGKNVIISFEVTIYSTNSHSLSIEERKQDAINTLNYLNGKSISRKINWKKIISEDVVIEDEVWIGFGATILKGVTIGRGAIVGAKSVVTHNIAPYTVVAGNPARVVKKLKEKNG